MEREPTAEGSEPATLAELVRELQSTPAGDSRVSRARVRALAFAERVTTRGPFAPVAELAWGVQRRVSDAGGSALAALVAYRVFVWLLPVALVSVATLGLLAREGSIDPAQAVERFGIAGYFASSVAAASSSGTTSGKVYALTFGALFLLYETYVLVRGVRAIHARAWRLPIRPVPRPLQTTVFALVLLVGWVLASGLLDGVGRQGSTLLALLVLVAGALLTPALWLLVSLALPHRATRWTELLPGVALLGIAAAGIHFLVVYLLVPYLEEKEETYGALGLAAGVMVALYAVGWAIVVSVSLNAELHDRRLAAARPT